MEYFELNELWENIPGLQCKARKRRLLFWMIFCWIFIVGALHMVVQGFVFSRGMKSQREEIQQTVAILNRTISDKIKENPLLEQCKALT